MAGVVSLAAVRDAMSAHLTAVPAGRLLLGFSGGLDSTVLLHLLSSLPAARARDLRAIHVDHGLQPQASAWAQHCREVAAAHDVPCLVESVQVARDGGLGIEAAARAARYAAFARHLRPGDILVLAHHRDDQVETVLLRLLNASGNEGVAGMRAWRAFGAAWLWRPLLEQPRAALESHAEAHALDRIDDPSNDNPRFARNRLRHEVLPALRAAWPDADARIAAAAARLREEADTLDALAQQQRERLQAGSDPAALDLVGLRELPAALRRRVIGCWLDTCGLPRPPPGIWRKLDTDLLDARADATPRLAWRGAELRRYRDRIHALRESAAPATHWRMEWSGRDPLDLPPGFGRLALQPAHAFDLALVVMPRAGGERILQHGLQRPLRLRLQELGIPPWQRERLPLLFDHDGILLAAGDRILSDTLLAWQQAHDCELRWTPAD